MPPPPRRTPKRKVNPLHAKRVADVDWKDITLLRTFISDRGKIRARRVTGLTPQQQRQVADRDPQRAGDGPAALPARRPRLTSARHPAAAPFRCRSRGCVASFVPAGSAPDGLCRPFSSVGRASPW